MTRLRRYWRLLRSLPADERRARAGRVLERAARGRRWTRRLGLVPDEPRWGALRRALACDLDTLCERLRVGDPRRGPLFDPPDPGRAGEIATAARAFLARRVALLGAPADWPGTADGGIDWHVDWRSGARWPAQEHHTKIDLVRGDGSDVRLPWELARFQHLVTLALARRLGLNGAPAEHCAAEARAQIEDWIRSNPRGLGIHWSCAMEVALRSVSWVATLAHCADAPSWDRAFVARLLRSLWIHGRHVRRHLEIGPGGRTTNHYLSNLLGLYVLGCALPELREAAAWRRHALAAFPDELRKQVHPDGVSFERSMGYHSFVLELTRLVAAHARRRGDTLAPDVVERIGGMTAFAAAMTRPDGSTPAWGDGDDGCVLPWTVGPPVEPSPASSYFPDAQVAILRVPGIHVFVSCGAVGTDGLGNHTHNDLLSFTLWANGVEWLADPGTGAYGGDVDLRNRLRSTAAHSTLQLERLEQNEPGDGVDGLFRMHERAHPEVTAWSADERRGELVARHTGYPGVSHERRFELDGAARCLTVVDRLEGEPAGRRATIRLVLSPRTRARPDGGGAWRLEQDGRSVRVELSLPDDARVELRQAPFSPSYGVVVTSEVLEATFRATTASRIATTRFEMAESE